MDRAHEARFARRLWGMVAGLLVVLAALVAVSVLNSREQHEEHVHVESFSTARVLASELNGLAEKMALATFAVAAERERQLRAASPDDAALRAYLGMLLASDSDLQAIRITDAAGRVVVPDEFPPEAVPSVGGTAFFARLREGKAAPTLVTGAFRDGPGGPWVVGFARAAQRPDGSFAGAVIALVAVERLESLLGGAEVAQGGAVALWGERLEAIAQYPPPPERGLGTSAPPAVAELVRRGEVSGSYRARSAVDGVERHYAFRRVPGHDLHVTVGRSTSEYLGHWRRDMRVVVVLAVILAAAAGGSAYVIQGAWRRERRATSVLEAQAHTDDLTGLANRRRFFEVAEGELARARRYGTDLSVLMLDIDHFKVVNDTHGHRAGDRVLQELARICLEVMRAVDVVARVGGEEFAILLPETALVGAVDVAERLREAVAKTAVAPDGGAPLRITISIGVAMLQENSDLDTLVSQSDTALYDAKRGGRNRVCAFRPGAGRRPETRSDRGPDETGR